MLRFRLHPTPANWVTGLAVIALWALLWLWFLCSVGDMMRTRPAQKVQAEASVGAIDSCPQRAATGSAQLTAATA